MSFGSVYLKSRSSDSFPAALKDFIAPEPVDISNCGTVIIHKQTDPGSSDTFEFTTNLATDPGLGDPPSFTLSDGGEEIILDVIAGNGYTVTESGIAAGFDLTGIDCSASIPDPVASIDLGTGTGTFDVEVGGIVECTFTNTARGNIVIAKVTDPGNDPATFTFTGNVAGLLGNGDTASTDVAPGAYSSTEMVPAGWDLTNIFCDDANSSGDEGTATASFNVEPGETVTCTFTDVKRGTIIIDKVTEPVLDPQVFAFTLSGGPDGINQVFNLTDAATPHDSGLQKPGMYNAAEAVPEGWDLTSATCSDDIDPGCINLQAGETVTCTFTNSTGAILITKTAKNFSSGPGLHPHAGITFEVRDGGTLIASVVTDVNSQACVEGLIPGVA